MALAPRYTNPEADAEALKRGARRLGAGFMASFGGPAVNPRRGANRNWDGRTASAAESGVAPQAATVATQGAASSVAPGGVLPPFMAPKTASPFPAAPAAPTAGPTRGMAAAIPSAPTPHPFTATGMTAASAPTPQGASPSIPFMASRPSPAPGDQLTPVQSPPRPFPGVASGVDTPPSVAQKIADSAPAAPAAAPSFIGSAPAAARTLPAEPGTRTFMRKSVIQPGTSNVMGGATVRPASELNVGGASVVVPGSVANAPNPSVPAMPTSNTQGFLDNLARATNAMSGIDVQPKFTDAQQAKNAAGNARLQRGFLSPRDRKDVETAERREYDRGFLGDKLTAAKEIEKTKGEAAVGMAREQAQGEAAKAEADARNPRGGRFRETYTGGVLDTATGSMSPPPISLDTYSAELEKRQGKGFLTFGKDLNKSNLEFMDKEWEKTGLPPDRAPHRGGRGLDFDTPEEVESMNLPRGTRITIRGRPAIVE